MKSSCRQDTQRQQTLWAGALGFRHGLAEDGLVELHFDSFDLRVLFLSGTEAGLLHYLSSWLLLLKST